MNNIDLRDMKFVSVFDSKYMGNWVIHVHGQEKFCGEAPTHESLFTRSKPRFGLTQLGLPPIGLTPIGLPLNSTYPHKIPFFKDGFPVSECLISRGIVIFSPYLKSWFTPIWVIKDLDYPHLVQMTLVEIGG